MNGKIPKHPLNAAGKYFVDPETCACSRTCISIAPNNFVIHGNYYGAYVFKQPETAEEEAQCREAKEHCPLEAIYDDGE